MVAPGPEDADDRTRSFVHPDEPDGAAGHRCLVVFWPGGVAAYELPAHGTVTIGRSADCEIRIDHSSVSRRHAAIVVDEDVRVEDLGSANGTRVGGRRIDAGVRIPLARGTLLEVGLATAIVQSGAAIPAQIARPVREAASDENRSTRERLEQLVDLVAQSNISVVLLGETGVGKEVTAEKIHARSRRAEKPLVRLNCAAFPETLLETELFGHERGAFTGAVKKKTGLLEAAHGGTVFLDEVAELSPAIQAKLLRVLESREITPVGGITPRAIDVRFVAASNRDLEELVGAGTFRRDLYYRLNGITIRIPPLRDRRAEIPGLTRAFLEAAAREAGRAPPALTDAALEKLVRAPWEGNVRELRNVVERAFVLAAGGRIEPQHVDLPTARAAAALRPAAASLRDELDTLERQRIVEALDRCSGNQTEAAKLLGMSRRALLNRLDAFDLPRPRKR